MRFFPSLPVTILLLLDFICAIPTSPAAESIPSAPPRSQTPENRFTSVKIKRLDDKYIYVTIAPRNWHESWFRHPTTRSVLENVERKVIDAVGSYMVDPGPPEEIPPFSPKNPVWESIMKLDAAEGKEKEIQGKIIAVIHEGTEGAKIFSQIDDWD